MKSHNPRKCTVSYAQNTEDIVLLRSLQDLDCGFYVDLGAADPVYDSVTKLFYDIGWAGINVEPNEEYYQVLCSERVRDINLCMAASSVSGQKEIDIFSNTGLSTLECRIADIHKQNGFEAIRKFTLTRTLNDILSEYMPPNQEINFLKIDVEGHEEEVIRAFDLVKYRPWIIIYEATKPNTNIINDGQIPHILESGGYAFCFFDGINKYFVLDELTQIKEKLYPANVLDNFIHYSSSRLIAKIKELEGKLIIADRFSRENSVQFQHAVNSYSLLESALHSKDRELEIAAKNYDLVLVEINNLHKLISNKENEIIKANDGYQILLVEHEKTKNSLSQAACDYQKALDLLQAKDAQLMDAHNHYQLLMRELEEIKKSLAKAGVEYSQALQYLRAKDIELEKAAESNLNQLKFIAEKDKELENAQRAYNALMEFVIQKDGPLDASQINEA